MKFLIQKFDEEDKNLPLNGRYILVHYRKYGGTDFDLIGYIEPTKENYRRIAANKCKTLFGQIEKYFVSDAVEINISERRAINGYLETDDGIYFTKQEDGSFKKNNLKGGYIDGGICELLDHGRLSTCES